MITRHDDANKVLAEAVERHQSGDLATARKLYRRLLRDHPRHADALNLFGLAELHSGRPAEAERLIREAIASNGQFAAFHSNLGYVLLARGEISEALAAYRQAVAIDPDFIDGWHNLADLASRTNDHEQAVLAYSQLVRLSNGQDGVALGYLGLGLACLCEWDNLEAVRNGLLALPSPENGGKAVPPFSLLIHDFSPDVLRGFADETATMIRQSALAGSGGRRFQHSPSARRQRLRVAYLSEDFHEHATAYLIADMLENHDRSRFEIYAYSYGPDDASPMRQRLRQAVEHFTDMVAATPLALAQRIQADGIDLLVDLKGHTGLARTQILPLHPAPLQLAWLGFPGTFGGSDLDYIIADGFVIPEGLEDSYSEAVIRLPHCYQPNDRHRIRPAPPSDRTLYGLPADGIVFCVFHNSFKITAAVFDLWLCLLRRHPASVLWFLDCHPLATKNLRRIASERGIDPQRLVFAPRVPQQEHLQRLAAADLFLDSHPCGAHTTASDALWLGVPVITRVGTGFASRVAGSLLRSLGLEELITEDPESYLALADSLAGDPQRRKNLREKLLAAGGTSPVFDGGHFARHLEEAYDQAWERWSKGLAPEPFSLCCEQQ